MVALVVEEVVVIQLDQVVQEIHLQQVQLKELMEEQVNPVVLILVVLVVEQQVQEFKLLYLCLIQLVEEREQHQV